VTKDGVIGCGGMCFIPTDSKDGKKSVSSEVIKVKRTKIKTLFACYACLEALAKNVNVMTDHQV
jgi:hypothetical protein